MLGVGMLSKEDAKRLIRSLMISNTEEMRELRLNKFDFHMIKTLKKLAPVKVEELGKLAGLPDSYVIKSVKTLKKCELITETFGIIELVE